MKAKVQPGLQRCLRLLQSILGFAACGAALLLVCAGCSQNSSAHGPRAGCSWTNSLGMVFVPVKGTKVLFCIWPTRLQDFKAFTDATSYDTGKGLAIVHHVGGDGMERNGEWRADLDWQHPGFVQGPTHPVVGVNFADAHAFCDWLTQTEQKDALLAHRQRYRLPTDKELRLALCFEEHGAFSQQGPVEGPWPTPEMQAKAKNLFPWGNQWPPPEGAGNIADRAFDAKYGPAGDCHLESYDDGYAETSPVGSFKPNSYGLYDLAGNVEEWSETLTFDGEHRYPKSTGSSWRTSAPGELGSWWWSGGDARTDHVGFRCVLVLK